MTPEYLHIVLNHIPLLGLGIGGLLLVAGLARKSTDIRSASLILIAVAGLLAWPVAETGEEAADRMTNSVDAAGKHWLEEHEERAEKTVPAAVTAAVLAVLALMVSKVKPSWVFGLSLTCLLACLVSLGLLAWTAKAGGQISHPELRSSPLNIEAASPH